MSKVIYSAFFIFSIVFMSTNTVRATDENLAPKLEQLHKICQKLDTSGLSLVSNSRYTFYYRCDYSYFLIEMKMEPNRWLSMKLIWERQDWGQTIYYAYFQDRSEKERINSEKREYVKKTCSWKPEQYTCPSPNIHAYWNEAIDEWMNAWMAKTRP